MSFSVIAHHTTKETLPTIICGFLTRVAFCSTSSWTINFVGVLLSWMKNLLRAKFSSYRPSLNNDMLCVIYVASSLDKTHLVPTRTSGGDFDLSSLVLMPSTAEMEKGCWTMKPKATAPEWAYSETAWRRASAAPTDTSPNSAMVYLKK